MKDIYFEPKYGKIYEKAESGICNIYEFSNSNGIIKHMFIKREIPILIDKNQYYDLITPYGYGGPLIIESNEASKDQLIEDFKLAFQDYCITNNIVSEFIRFHPIIKNAQDFQRIYKIKNLRTTVATDIQTYSDPFKSEFSKSARKSIRRAVASGVNFKVTEKPNNIDEFKRIYYSTMDRNDASYYYYFDDDYFGNLINDFKDNLILVEAIYDNKTIASGLYFVYGDLIHAHISGTLSEYLYLSPAYIVKYATVIWALENKISLIHYGGGTSNSKEDPLYKFKKKFGKNTEFQFYIGKNIWNYKVYHDLCKKEGLSPDTDFFPAYRSSINE